MTAPADVEHGALADCYAPVPMAWRLVIPGETFLGGDGAAWYVLAAEATDAGVRVHVVAPGREWRGVLDPDELVRVLVAVPERDAAELLRAELGARIIARRGGGST